MQFRDARRLHGGDEVTVKKTGRIATVLSVHVADEGPGGRIVELEVVVGKGGGIRLVLGHKEVRYRRTRPRGFVCPLSQTDVAMSGCGNVNEEVLPKPVADRLHRWGDKDCTYGDFVDRFQVTYYDTDGIEFGERYFYDPETRKTYQTRLKLKIEQSEPPNEDTCPECGEGLADAMDIPDDVICDACGWSRSGVRRCIRCGTKDGTKLVEGDSVCMECRK